MARSSHSGTARYYIEVPEWLEPFWHGQSQYVSARMARAILALPVAILECQNGLSHSSTAWYYIGVPEWLEPFWHGLVLYWSARMARAILARPGTILECQNGSARPVALLECQNGSSHSGTAWYYIGVPEPFWHGQLQYLSARMARAILAPRPVAILNLSARMARAILPWPVAILECQNGSCHSGTASSAQLQYLSA